MLIEYPYSPASRSTRLSPCSSGLALGSASATIGLAPLELWAGASLARPYDMCHKKCIFLRLLSTARPAKGAGQLRHLIVVASEMECQMQIAQQCAK